MNRRSTFKQSDIKRAVKGVTDAGLSVARIEIDHSGKIILMTDAELNNAKRGSTEWDTRLE